MIAATARASRLPAQKDAGQACNDSVVAGLVACAKGGENKRGTRSSSGTPH